MDRYLFCFIIGLLLALPVTAADTTGGDVVDGIVFDADASGSSDPTDSEAAASDEEPALETEESSEDIAALDVSGDLAGGYYFVCDSALGYGLTFYVPLEWAHDVFTLDSSGTPVNLSTNTCYAYCPDFPDYTISCSRFGTFTYRATNYNTADLRITNITDTNMTFFDDNGIQMSGSELQLLSCVLLFVLAAILIMKRG